MAASRELLLELDYYKNKIAILELDNNCLNNQPANTINDLIN